MPFNFVILCLHTLFSWFLVSMLYRRRLQYTLIPLYAFMAILTLLAQSFNDMGLFVEAFGFYFWIGSISYFTTIMFGTLILYLFEGPRAARTALWVVVTATIFYLITVLTKGLLVNSEKWVTLSQSVIISNLWSIIAVVLDIVFLGIGWEILSKFSKIPLMMRVFLIVLGIMYLDALIYNTGAFGGTKFYWQIMQGGLITRLWLSILAAPIMTISLKFEGFSEIQRSKPKHLWEIVNFKSDLENKVVDLETALAEAQKLETQLKNVQSTYELVLNGTGAGIFEVDYKKNQVICSPKMLKMLGYAKDELNRAIEDFYQIVHPDELESAKRMASLARKTGTPQVTELRLKTKGGEYRWFDFSLIVELTPDLQPIRGAGSITDISQRKEAELGLQEKLDELTRMNKVMVDRELKMSELKAELQQAKQVI